jgi:hypothetical protein
LAPFPQCNLMLPVKLHFDNEFSGPVNVFVTGISVKWSVISLRLLSRATHYSNVIYSVSWMS